MGRRTEAAYQGRTPVLWSIYHRQTASPANPPTTALYPRDLHPPPNTCCAAPATRLSRHLREARCRANRYALLSPHHPLHGHCSPRHGSSINPRLSFLPTRTLRGPSAVCSVVPPPRCSSGRPEHIVGSSPSQPDTPTAPVIYLECRVQWPFHGNSREP